jgi:hypothetical protein
VRWPALVLVGLALTGCETTAEKSAQLERAAKRAQAGALGAGVSPARGLSITRKSTRIRVGRATILHDSEGTAAAITLDNVSTTPLRNVPIAITVRDAGGSPLYTNDAAGLAPALVSAPLLPAHGSLTWIDDQVQAAGVPASVTATVGEGERVTGAIPALAVQGVHFSEDQTSGLNVEGSVLNRSHIGQRELVVYCSALRGGKIVAAGRALVPLAAAGAATRFQIYFVGDPRGAQLKLSAPASTLG